jgi:hypothetical protein
LGVVSNEGTLCPESWSRGEKKSIFGSSKYDCCTPKKKYLPGV